MSLHEQPNGVVTFLFSDIEDSTPLWERHRSAMRAALAEHDRLLQTAVESNGGVLVKTTGDGIHAVFASPSAALAAAVDGQRALRDAQWPNIAPERIRVRMGLHTGEAELRAGDYYGMSVNRAARIMGIGHGEQILLSETTANLVRESLADGARLLDLGEHQLKGLSRPAHVFQIEIPGLPRDFPPLNSGETKKGNLPQPLTNFIGREREKSEVKQLLASSRLLTLTGPGGTGKTRLALEVAREVQDIYKHGVWFVELAPLSDPATVPTAVAGLWGLRDDGRLTQEEALASYLRGKELLLILDNCEHLVAASAKLADGLLAAAPLLTILASSREGLGVPGETTYHLPALRVPGRDVVEPQELQEFEGVQLFLDRARAARPSFELTAANSQAVGQIVRRLDGIPLAIELAAARLKLLPPEQLAERLDDRFRLLTGGSRTALPRQQTLRALIDWSYDYLEPGEQALFRQLGVFSGGWSLEAAEAVANLETGFLPQNAGEAGHAQKTRFLDIFDLLANLINKSLVVMDDQGGQARFFFLETIRQYARERLFESGEGPSARDRHLDYYAELVLEGKSADLNESSLTLFAAMGSPAMLQWVRQTLVEIDNVRAAMQWALQTNPELALAMAVKLPAFFVFHGPAQEAREQLSAALHAVRQMEPAGQQAEKRREILLLQGGIWLGNLQMGEGLQKEAVETLATVVARAREGNYPYLLALALGIQSLPLTFLNHPDAYETAANSLAILEEMGNEDLLSLPLGSMIMAKLQQGDLETAQDLKKRARALIKNSRGSFVNAMQIVTLARYANRSSEYEEAEELLLTARNLFVSMGSRNFQVMTDSELGHIRRHMGDDAAALAIYRRTIREWQDLGHQSAVANQLESFAFLAIHAARYRRAATLLGAAEALRLHLDVDMLPDERKEYETELAVLREQMEADNLRDAWAGGRQLDLDAAVDLALSE